MADDALWVIGDVQGYLEPLQRVLASIGVIDANGSWTGSSATLAVLGDLVDRGPDGIGVIELLMRLQSEADRAGGRVLVVVGNHDVLFLAAHDFGHMTSAATGRTFLTDWELSGGVQNDLSRLTQAHVGWLKSLPAMWLAQDALMMHADALMYLNFGASIDEVNARFGEILHGDDVASWDRLLAAFAEHRAFLGPDGCVRAEGLLNTLGGQTLIHGHTPIARVTRQPPETVTSPYVYCDGRCVNVDPGLYLGGPGFAYKVTHGRRVE
jgi:Calcineurin-like phosphoesterase